MPKSLTASGSTAHWRRVRAYILRRDGLTCWRCGVRLTTHDRRARTHATVGHKVRRVDGGTDHASNLAPECLRCNASDGGRARSEPTYLRRVNASRVW